MKTIIPMTMALTVAAGAANALSVTPNTNATDLANALIGTGVSLVGAPTFTGGAVQAGTFTGGAAEFGINQGVVLSSGDVSEIPGANATPTETLGVGAASGADLSTDVGTPGDGSIPGSNDAAVLEFMFQFGDGSVGGDLSFGYVFASEEYIDFVDSDFNDAFRLEINGSNVAFVNGDEVEVNTVNPNQNAGSYINNVPNTDGFPVAGRDILADGLTTFLASQMVSLSDGTHTARFIVADVEDSILDSFVAIQAGSFDPDMPEMDVVPVPAALPLLASGIAGLALFRRRRT